MRYFLLLLTLMALSLTTSSCGVLWSFYESQRNYPAPDHNLELNDEYEILWNLSDINTGGAGTTPMIVGAPNKIIIMGSPNGTVAESKIFAIDSNSGEILWEGPGFSGNIIASDNAVYVGTYGTATVHSFNIEDGKSLWSTWLPTAHSTWNIYFANNKIFVFSDNSEFYVLDEQGEILDRFHETSDMFLEIGGVLYMAKNYSLKAVEYASREELWQLDIGEGFTVPNFDDGEIFLKTRNDDIYSIDRYLGKINWVTSQDVQSNFCLIGNKIYFTNPDSELIAIDQYSSHEISRVKFSPQFDLDKQIGDYYVACDATNNVIAISFGDNAQIMGLKILNP